MSGLNDNKLTKKKSTGAKKVAVSKARPKKTATKAKTGTVVSSNKKNTTSKKATKTVSGNNATRNTTNKTRTTKSANKKGVNDIVNLPRHVTPALLRRLEIYKTFFRDKIDPWAQRTTTGTGYLFILFGLTVTVFLLSADTKEKSLPYQGVVASTIESVEVSGSESETLKPSLEFTGDYPAEPTENFIGLAYAENIAGIRFYVLNNDTRHKTLLDIKTHDVNNYEFKVSVTDLEPGVYSVVAKADNLSEDKIYTFSGPTFEIVEDTSDTTETTTHTTTAETSDDTTDTQTEDEITTATTDDTAVSIQENTDTDSIDSTEEDSVLSEFNVDSDDGTPVLALTLETDFSDKKDEHFNFTIKNNLELPFVEMYAQPKLSRTPLFLGLANNQGQGKWSYVFKANSLPSGDYNLFAKSKVRDKFLYSDTVYLSTTQYYDSLDTTYEDVGNDTVLTEEITNDMDSAGKESDGDSDLLKQREEYYTAIEKESSASMDSIDNIAREESELILKEAETEINERLKRYASTLQTKNDSTIRVAKDELLSFQNELLLDASTNPRTKDISGSVATNINTKFSALIKKVEDYEKIIASSSELISRDSDNDGISDFDENTIYNTDPRNPDTDNDGVLDGIEIARGYDPLNVDKTASINFQSPKEVSYIDEENLVIASVKPVVETTEHDYEIITEVQITGKARPNSFVTLYIYSSPTIVTVKTNDEGDFVYNFSKEMADGEHEVYAAVTDNTGRIIARSTAFRFTKTAQAFTVTDNEEPAYPSYTQTDNSNSILYNITVAMAIVSLGLILLLLVKAIRQEDNSQFENHAKNYQISD